MKDGKIVLEKYFGSFTKDSVWYWASAGKTITSFLTGTAQEAGLLSINDTTSKYLGTGWTNCTAAQEKNIKIRNHITMTTGLDDAVADNHCIIDTCLQYLANPGTRWAYHNAPYTLLKPLLEAATGQPLNTYTQLKLKAKTGMTGAWYNSGYDNVFYSKPRSMARFGLLIQNDCIWNTDTLMYDTAYKHQMVNTSQSLNPSYGYFWWLNGKASYMVPTSQIIIPGSYAPAAPADMIAAIGKNGQIISIAKSKGLVFIRMGEAPTSPGTEVSTLFCNQIWIRINNLACTLLLDLLSFAAQAKNTTVQLSWNTANEINTSYFDIQRSENGIEFKTVGSIYCNPNQSGSRYTFIDNVSNVEASKIYYRLKQFDKDLTHKISSVISVKIYNGNEIHISPNPACNRVTVSGGDIRNVELHDATGKLILLKNVEMGSRNISIDISSITKGIYIVKVAVREGSVSQRKLLVQ